MKVKCKCSKCKERCYIIGINNSTTAKIIKKEILNGDMTTICDRCSLLVNIEKYLKDPDTKKDSPGDFDGDILKIPKHEFIDLNKYVDITSAREAQQIDIYRGQSPLNKGGTNNEV